jgi:hypothetical protein
MLNSGMQRFELRHTGNGLELSGGQLKDETLKFPGTDTGTALRVVAFLSKRTGSVLLIFNTAGEVIETHRRDPVSPMDSRPLP